MKGWIGNSWKAASIFIQFTGVIGGILYAKKS